MKVRIAIAAVIVSLFALPAFAQTRSVDLTGYVSWVDPNGNGAFDRASLDDIDVDFESETGYGLGLNVFFTDRFSVEFAATSVESDVAFESSNPLVPAFTGGSLEMIPITATLQWHFNPEGRFDPYVGAGAAYVLFDDLDGRDDIDDIDLDAIEFEDDAGFVVNAGASFDITPNFALNLDAKYVPVSSAATAVFSSGPGVESDIDINPLILSAGLSLQF
jgi:outer membrane protein